MTKDVIIDGVRYVPAIEAHPNMEAIAAGLISSFWGVVNERGDALKEKMEGLTVLVYDDGQGEPIEDILGLIAEQISD